jgi:hypothetical protein
MGKRFIVFFFLAVALFGCSKQSNANVSELEKQFSKAFPLADINKSLQISVKSQEASFKSGSEIDLIIYNKSPYSLYFDNDSHIRLLGSSDNLHWANVKNDIFYDATLRLLPKGTLFDTRSDSVKPILDQSSFSANKRGFLLRIVIVGDIMEGAARTGKKVGAYVDVVLKP